MISFCVLRFYSYLGYQSFLPPCRGPLILIPCVFPPILYHPIFDAAPDLHLYQKLSAFLLLHHFTMPPRCLNNPVLLTRHPLDPLSPDSPRAPTSYAILLYNSMSTMCCFTFHRRTSCWFLQDIPRVTWPPRVPSCQTCPSIHRASMTLPKSSTRLGLRD